MNNASIFIRCLAALCIAALMSATAHAASKKDPTKEALRRMQMQVKQAQDEKAALEQEKTALGQELETLRKKTGEIESATARANRGKAAAEKETEALKREKAELGEKITKLEKQLGESQQSLRDTRQSLQGETSQRQRLEQDLGVRGRELGVCETKNAKLYRYQVELIDRAQAQGSFSALLAAEPFTQIKRVEIENILEEYRDKIDAERVGAASRASAGKAD